MADPDGVRLSGSYVEESEESIRARVRRDLKAGLERHGFDLHEKIVLSARKLADDGHAGYLAGQVTVRTEDDTFWTTAFARNLGEVRRQDLVRFDRDMAVVEGESIPNPAVRFHLWVYDRRPDVGAIVHTHPPFASALSMTGERLAVAHMDAMMFFDNCSFLPEWPGLPVGNEEGEIISEALGDKGAAILAHHGIITVGKSIEEALYLAISLENAARLHMRARSLGEIRRVREELGPEARDFLLSKEIVHTTFDAWARMTAARHPEALG